MRVEYYWYTNLKKKEWTVWSHNFSHEDSLIHMLDDPDCNECVMIVPNTCQEELD